MDVELLFARGREAADRGNYDYAIAVFRDILRQDLDHTRSRITLRGCEMARFQERGGGVKAVLSGYLAGVPALIMMHLPGPAQRTIEYCERFLERVPGSILVLKRLARACRKAGHLEAAVNTLEFARQRKEENMGVVRLLGDMYAEKEDFKRASRCYEELEKRHPTDRVLVERLRNLRAADHLQGSKLEETKSAREQIRDVDKAKELEESGHLVRTTDDVDTVIARCQEKLKENPSDVESLIKLGDMYARKEQDKFAFAAYEKALELSPRYTIKVRIGDLKIRQFRRAESEAAEAAKRQSTSAELQQKAREAKQARLDFAIREFEQRYGDHPTEIPLAHQLGMFYWEKGTPEAIAKAVEFFQKSVEDPRHKPRARLMLAQCFATDPRTRDMAISQYEQALAMVTSPTSDTAKTIQYNLGQLCEQAGDNPAALDWYKKVFSVDAGFRDVRRKIEQLA